MKNRKATSTLCGIAALYMFYTAYQLIPGQDPNSTMSPAACWIFLSFFVIAGIGLLVICGKQYRMALAEEKEQKDNESLK